jgi:6-phosphogluconolactonase
LKFSEQRCENRGLWDIPWDILKRTNSQTRTFSRFQLFRYDDKHNFQINRPDFEKNMTTETKIFADTDAVAAGFAEAFASWLDNSDQGRPFSVALSGGSTPKVLFQLWASQYSNSIDWSRVKFFWGDERCVAPDDDESNFGVAKKLFFDKANLPESVIHRVLGESDPQSERVRYQDEIVSIVGRGDQEKLPQFDLIILGMGDDGHTASIFPHEDHFLKSTEICEVATHPSSGQKRITLTGPVINAAKRVAFLITGANKADVLAQVINKAGEFESFPASHIQADELTFFLDQAAAAKL